MFKDKLSDYLNQAWYSRTGLTTALTPLSWLFKSISKARHYAYRANILKSTKLELPVIVVGNLTVGGTGKTPLVIWIANFLSEQGYKPGIVSRGYTGQAQSWPQQVRPDADPVIIGDEAVVVSRRTNCPMAVGPDRADDGLALIQHNDIDVIISDDGLQHYALQRNIEIVVIDGLRRFGNGLCLPAGPLREPPSRLKNVDLIVSSGVSRQGEYTMKLESSIAINLLSGEEKALSELVDKTLFAMAGIGNPNKFFNSLRSKGLRLESRSFPDHYYFKANDLDFAGDDMLFMTEKDAVKCQRFAKSNWWYVPVDARLDDEFGEKILTLIKEQV